MADTFKDEVLLEKARGGDQPAFLFLYERHRNQIFRFLYRFLGSAQIAEEITHDSFIGLVRGSEDSQTASPSFRNRLYLTARTLAMKYVQNSASAVTEKHTTKNDAIKSTQAADNEAQNASLVSEVAEAVAMLPPLEREAFILSEYEDLDLPEIAVIVGADLGTVVARIGSARQKLRNALANHLFTNR